ncbi:MAG TPA: aminoacyl-tRNA hydrolase [Candidatus Hydrogenedentes bacterium]|nr:aminoacyl-tRNA hydrolase [Candidatus Hydrogenedentota bacterium]
MKLIVGLGNPGQQYRNTRHNVGFRVLDEVADRLNVRFDQEKYDSLFAMAEYKGTRVMLLKPLTFMNLSGGAVAKAARNRVPKPEHVLVVLDEIQLPLGTVRIRHEGSGGGHNGLKSVIEHLGTREFPRLRIGIGEKKTGQELSDHVLSTFTPAEKPDVDQAVASAADAVLCYVAEGVNTAMNRFNKRTGSDGATG